MVYQVKDKDDFQKKLEEAGGGLVVVDFYATWCGPCKLIAPELDVMTKEFGNVMFLKVDVDECEDVAMDYRINAMPTFIFFKNGEMVETHTGANSQKLRQIIQMHQ